MNMKKSLSFGSLVALTLSSQLGSGLFFLPASLASFGSISLMVWIFASLGALVLCHIFGELACMHPGATGMHTFIGHSLGSRWAFYASWAYWVSIWVGLVPVLLTIGNTVSHIIPAFGGMKRLGLELGILWLGVCVNWRGASLSATTESWMTILRFIIFGALFAYAACFVRFEHFTPFVGQGYSWFGAFKGAFLMSIWGFLGIESLTSVDGCSPKYIARAIKIGTLIVGVVYLLSNFLLIGVLSLPSVGQSLSPFTLLAQTVWPSVSWAVPFLIIWLCCSNVLSWQLITEQASVSAAKAQRLPSIFLRTNSYHASKAGLLIPGSLSSLIIIAAHQGGHVQNYLDYAINVLCAATIIIYTLCVVCYAHEHRQRGTYKMAQKFLVVSSFVFCGTMLLGTSLYVWLALSFLPLTGHICFLMMKKKSL